MKKNIVGIMVLGLAAGIWGQAPYGLEERVPNNSLLISLNASPLAEMEMRRVFSALFFSQPVVLTHAGDNSGRLFVVEKPGVIKVFPNRNDVTTAKTFLDISAQVNDNPNEAGLLGLAFHPQYQENGRFYLSYTRGSLVSRVSEFRVGNNPDRADPASERVILEVNQPAGNHNGGQVDFGPDGYLYFALGDGGGSNDTFRNGQDRTTLLGNILRIDVDGQEQGLGYAVPPDNPFVGNTEGWREEIWAWGLRNPWRFSFDRQSGELWTGDVGQNNWEEVDIIKKGGNYGWNTMEGFHCFSPSANCSTEGLELPVVEYDHGDGRSITGGYVYRGKRLRRMVGVYLYADFVTQRIWGMRYNGTEAVDNRLLALSPGNVSSFGQDEDGEVYIVNFGGDIYVLDEKPANAPPDNLPQTIAASGLYHDVPALTPAPGLIPYSVNAQLWSDGAAKTRYLALPGTAKIGFRSQGAWEFPNGSVIVKNFFLDLQQGDLARRKIIETRFMVKRLDGEAWDGFSYMWNDAGTDAVLLEGDSTKVFTVIDAAGVSRSHTHIFPDRTDCITCHTPAAGYILGVRTAQLNKVHDYDEVLDNQLRSLNHIGIFGEDIGEDPAAFDRMPDPSDSSVNIQDRARAYLDANCAQCHRPGGATRSHMDLRFEVPLEQAGLVDEAVIPGGLEGVADIVRRGVPQASALYRRMVDLGQDRMPPLSTAVVDVEGSAVVRQWIEGLGASTVVASQVPAQPADFVLEQNYPNPFNASTAIGYTLARAETVNLLVFDLLGRKLRVLEREMEKTAGFYTITWDGRDTQGRPVGAGVYFYRLYAGEFTQVRKMILVK